MSILIAWSITLLAANITQEQANDIVLTYAQSEAPQFTALYALNEPDANGIVITTSEDESFTAKYASWAYCLEEPAQRRYLFVKKDGGNLLEVIASNDVNKLDEETWELIGTTGLALNKANTAKLLYPNPVGDVLTLPCGANTRVEIYDLKGTRLFSGLLSGEDTCQLDVSFLNTGVYMVNVSGEMYRIIKK
jgi:hypothetical protein